MTALYFSESSYIDRVESYLLNKLIFFYSIITEKERKKFSQEILRLDCINTFAKYINHQSSFLSYFFSGY